MSLQIWYQFLILHVKYKALKTREKISYDKLLQIQLTYIYTVSYKSAF